MRVASQLLGKGPIDVDDAPCTGMLIKNPIMILMCPLLTKGLILFRCEQDDNLMGSDFDSVETSVSGIKRYWALLYVFKFYNSGDLYFECTVTVCPSGSSNCDIVSTVKILVIKLFHANWTED